MFLLMYRQLVTGNKIQVKYLEEGWVEQNEIDMNDEVGRRE